MSDLINALDRQGVPLKSFMSLLSMRSPQNNLRGLAKFADEEQQVEAVEVLANSYLRFPARKTVELAFNELVLLTRWKCYRAAVRKGALADIHTSQRLLNKVAAMLNLKDDAAIAERVETIQKELTEALVWHADLEAWAQKHQGELYLVEGEQNEEERKPRASCLDCGVQIRPRDRRVVRCAACQAAKSKADRRVDSPYIIRRARKESQPHGSSNPLGGRVVEQDQS